MKPVSAHLLSQSSDYPRQSIRRATFPASTSPRQLLRYQLPETLHLLERLADARLLSLRQMDARLGLRHFAHTPRRAANGTSVILVLNQYKRIGCSPGKHPDTRTMATGSDEDSRDILHDRYLCISV